MYNSRVVVNAILVDASWKEYPRLKFKKKIVLYKKKQITYLKLSLEKCYHFVKKPGSHFKIEWYIIVVFFVIQVSR